MSLNTGAIIGIAVGCGVVAAVVVAVLLRLGFTRKKKPVDEPINQTNNETKNSEEKTSTQPWDDTDNSCISVTSGECPEVFSTQFFDAPSTVNISHIDLNKQIQWFNSLGSGSFGEVWRAMYTKKNGDIVDVAVKMPHYNQFLEAELQQNKGDQSLISRELDMMYGISHPNVVKCYGGCFAPKVAIVMEYVGGGDLYDFLHKRQQPLTYDDFFKIAIGLGAGLSALHPHVVHRDLKPQNILMDENGNPKITDFGLSSAKQQSYAITSGKKGTVKYMPPEAWKEDAAKPWKFSEKYDIYAVGLILWECITLKEPFEESGQFSVIKDISDGVRPTIPPGVPRRIASLIQACWSQNTKDRPKAQEIYNKFTLIKNKMRKNLYDYLPGENKQGEVNISIEEQPKNPKHPKV